MGTIDFGFPLASLPFLLNSSPLCFPVVAKSLSIGPRACIIWKRWSQSFLIPGIFLGLKRKLLVSISYTVQASEKISVLEKYSWPMRTQGERYSRVWMSSVKCLYVKQAFPRSAILKKSLSLSLMRTLFQYRIDMSTPPWISLYSSNKSSSPCLFGVQIFIQGCCCWLDQEGWLLGDQETLDSLRELGQGQLGQGLELLSSLFGDTSSDQSYQFSSLFSAFRACCFFFFCFFFSNFFLLLGFLEVWMFLRYFMLMGLTLQFLSCSTICSSSEISILIMMFSGLRSVCMILQRSCRYTSPSSTSLVIFLTNHKGMRFSLYSQCWMTSSKLGPMSQNTLHMCLPCMP